MTASDNNTDVESLQIDDKGSTDITASDKSMEQITDSTNIPGEVEALDTAALVADATKMFLDKKAKPRSEEKSNMLTHS